MSQITDDCFAFGGPLMRASEALELIRARTPAVTGPDTRPLADAAGHVLAENIMALSASPPQHNAAVDGYAFRGADLDPGGETCLRLRGRAAAGHPEARPLQPGEAARIFTGAAMPRGADTVVMQEDVRLAEDCVLVPAGLKAGANCRRAGEDVAAGQALLKAGTRLGPSELALAAAGGLAHLPVRARPRVALVSTGDEIRPPGSPLNHGDVHDANAPMLMALLRRIGIEARHHGIVADNPSAVRETLRKAADAADLVISSGGASTGDEDHVRDAVGALGAVHLWRLAIKPGRPLAFGHVRGTAFVGLPGNPVAVMVCFLMFVRPLLDRLEGAEAAPHRRWPVAAGFEMQSKPDRLEWLRGVLRRGEDGEMTVERHPRQGSGIIHSLTDSDGLIEIPEAVTTVRRGDRLGFISFREALS